jgi:aminobenzoyl-glutamate utilization protein B
VKSDQDIIAFIEQKREDFTRMADFIWENPEIALKEVKASHLQADYLEKQGFKISWGSGGMPTAFIAEWGSSKPIIGFIGEYDALKNLSQKLVPEQEALVPGECGQGCGHNLLGTGALAAAVAVKQWMIDNGTKGTIRYYGCPGEEILAGKVYMARDGAFNDLDAGLNFHPSAYNAPSKGSCVALNNLKFHFYGKAAHAGGSPHLGRSALDGVELMNVGANYLREHVEDSTRIHYVITHGGDLPNIVPAEAEVWYFVRAPRRDQVDAITNRLRKIAEGAAMMTETTFKEQFITGCHNMLSNKTMADLQYEKMQIVGPIEFSDEEKAYAKKVNDGYPEENHRGLISELKLPSELKDEPLLGENYNALDEGHISGGSTDVGDVSWITPLSELETTCWATGAAGHSWGVVACVGTSIGHKGMLHAAKVMALTAADLFTHPEHLKKARDEFEAATKDHPYVTPLTPEARLPL